MGGEIFSVAVTMFVIVMVGLGVGFLMLKVQGAEE
ncbi:MAG: PetM family cytochrome b6-f complex subunit 7 [Cyanobacteria bacterium P01_D01_bin.56]